MRRAASVVPAPSYRTTSRTVARAGGPPAKIRIRSPGATSSSSAASAFRKTSPLPSSARETSPSLPSIVPNPSMRAGSAAKSVTRGSVWRCAGAWTATCSMIAGVTPSTRSVPASRASIVSTTDSSKYSTPVAAPRPVPSWTSAPFADTSSSVSPREATAAERIVWLMVSPVVSATATIAVPSMRPSTISAVRPRRRPTLRTPSFTSTGCRSARKPRTANATTSAPTSRTRTVPIGMPKSSVTPRPRTRTAAPRRRPRSGRGRAGPGRGS